MCSKYHNRYFLQTHLAQKVKIVASQMQSKVINSTEQIFLSIEFIFIFITTTVDLTVYRYYYYFFETM